MDLGTARRERRDRPDLRCLLFQVSRPVLSETCRSPAGGQIVGRVQSRPVDTPLRRARHAPVASPALDQRQRLPRASALDAPAGGTTGRLIGAVPDRLQAGRLQAPSNSARVGGRALGLTVAAAALSASGCAHQAFSDSASRQPPPSVVPTLSVASRPCSSSQLHVGIKRLSGAGGHTFFSIVLVNQGRPCDLFGYPGVSFLDADHHQLGASAYRIDGFFEDAGQPPRPVTLAATGRAHAILRVDNPDVPSPADCHQVSPKFLRVYPPGSRVAIVIPEREVTAMCLLDAPAIAPVRPGDPTLL